jgi:hypothetical protein
MRQGEIRVNPSVVPKGHATPAQRNRRPLHDAGEQKTAHVGPGFVAHSAINKYLPPHPALDQRRSVRTENPTINPDFALVRSAYHIRVANQANCLQTQVSKLIANMYGSRGLDTAQPSNLSSVPEQTTLAACAGDHVFGTLTLRVDSSSGLLADTLYRQQIDEVRATGRHVCEFTRLAMDPALSTPDVMASIFCVAFVLARQVHHRTDVFAEVHPRHVRFYQRHLGYKVAGPVRTCPRVNAPAVLMHLCLDYAEGQIIQLAGKSEATERSLYKLFLPLQEHVGLLNELITPGAVAA